MGLTQLLVTVLTLGFGALVIGPWALVQSILIIMGKIDDADGNPLV